MCFHTKRTFFSHKMPYNVQTYKYTFRYLQATYFAEIPSMEPKKQNYGFKFTAMLHMELSNQNDRSQVPVPCELRAPEDFLK